MGLCKCPKRRVTNQFCFEHRVNVCEYCIVTNHPKCVVQSYLRWLQDSDYNPTCVLCSKQLVLEDCVRLTCYHVIHWACLDHYARELPATTAPAGYNCPVCNVCIFPRPNLVSQVADVLREKLAGVNWARVGLGLPLLSEEKGPMKVNHTDSYLMPSHTENIENGPTSNSHETIIHVEEPVITFSRTDASGQQSRRMFKINDEDSPLVCDHDENKYKRRTFLDWTKRWINLCGSNRSYNYRDRPYFKLIVTLLTMAFLIFLFYKVGRFSNRNDPALDPKNNPDIRVMDD